MYSFRQPDLNAPRFRPKRCNILNAAFHKKFIKANPRYADMGLDEFKAIVASVNGKIWETVIGTRDGVELPEQLGNLFIGSCEKVRSKLNPDIKKSMQYGRIVQNRNWDSDEAVAKIFYTNFETRYRFKLFDIWGFSAVRNFKRTVAETFPKEYRKYITVNKGDIVSRFFRKYAIL